MYLPPALSYRGAMLIESCSWTKLFPKSGPKYTAKVEHVKNRTNLPGVLVELDCGSLLERVIDNKLEQIKLQKPI